IITDEMEIIDSANHAHRYLGIDTECNLTLESRGDPHIRRAIPGLGKRLLAEHHDHSPEEIAAATASTGRLHRAIDLLAREGSRTLKAFDPAVDPTLDALVPAHYVLDPEKPIDPDAIVADLVPDEHVHSSARYWLIASVFVVLALVAMAWRLTPLS